MSEFKVGDRATFELDGNVRTVFTVEEIDDGRLYANGRGLMVRAARARPWRPGDDEAAQHWRDRRNCIEFSRWAELSPADAAAVAAILRKYLPAPDEDDGDAPEPR
jgi:hypothetical protein